MKGPIQPYIIYPINDHILNVITLRMIPSDSILEIYIGGKLIHTVVGLNSMIPLVQWAFVHKYGSAHIRLVF
jgi:hypothetical protein